VLPHRLITGRGYYLVQSPAPRHESAAKLAAALLAG